MNYVFSTAGVYTSIHSSGAAVLPIVRTSGQAFADLSLSLDDSHQTEVLWMSTSGSGADRPYFDSLGKCSTATYFFSQVIIMCA